MTPTKTQTCQSSNASRIQGAVIGGILVGYGILAASLFIFGDNPAALIDHNAPYLIVLGISLFASIGPLIFSDVQKRFQVKGLGLGGLCADEALAPQRLVGVTGLGFVFGALLHQAVKLFFG